MNFSNIAIAENAKVKENEWNFFAFSYDHKTKKGLIQIGDSYGYHDDSPPEPTDFPVLIFAYLFPLF